MVEFFQMLCDNWWGILAIVLAGLLILFILSIFLYRIFFKRFYDILISAVSLIVFLPLLILLAIIVAINVKGNPFFSQVRPTKNNKLFKLKKFKTMTNKRDESGNLLPDSQRLTKLGKFLRATSIDELPELINIFLGQMSIIGPRPQLVKDLVFMDDEIIKRHSVKAGLTGLAQVTGRNNLTWDERFKYDLIYVKKVTFFGDIKIFFKTIFKVLLRKDVSTQGMATSEDYGDYLLRLDKITAEEYDNLVAIAKTMVSKKLNKHNK